MALQYFDIYKGLTVDGSEALLSGSGAPSLDAALGAMYEDITNGKVYIKVTAGTGTDKWETVATEEYVTNAVSGTISWREPVVAHDDSTTVIASAPTTVDGVALAANDRVLFSAISAGDGKNIYIYNGAGVGDFTEDTNNETTGDTAYVEGGTAYGGHRFTYNGTDWVRTDQASQDELGEIRTFVGKSGSGAEVPTYSATNFVTQGANLETAVGELDAAAQVNATDIDALEAQNLVTTGTGPSSDVDTVTARVAKWLVHVIDTTDSNKVNAFEVNASHDGTNVDSTAFAVLRPGGLLNSVAGIDLTVTLITGTDLRLNVSATNAVSITAKRLGYVV
jgi:hypothetical protein